MGNLTIQQVKHAKPRDKQYKMADGKGLSLLVMPNGSKLWRGKYRFGGKEKSFAIGVFPEIGISYARQNCACGLFAATSNLSSVYRRDFQKGPRPDV